MHSSGDGRTHQRQKQQQRWSYHQQPQPQRPHLQGMSAHVAQRSGRGDTTRLPCHQQHAMNSMALLHVCVCATPLQKLKC
jgi:hypothetical protein